MFIAFGLSGAIPAIHYAVMEGWMNAITYASLGWLVLMGALYILGALLYAGRIPERFFPGKCDIWVNFDYLLDFCSWSETEGPTRQCSIYCACLVNVLLCIDKLALPFFFQLFIKNVKEFKSNDRNTLTRTILSRTKIPHTSFIPLSVILNKSD